MKTAMHIPSKQWLAVKEISIAGATTHTNGLEMICSELDVLIALGKHDYITGLHFAFKDSVSCYFGNSIFACYYVL